MLHVQTLSLTLVDHWNACVALSLHILELGRIQEWPLCQVMHVGLFMEVGVASNSHDSLQSSSTGETGQGQ
jgi:hypothetical protein